MNNRISDKTGYYLLRSLQISLMGVQLSMLYTTGVTSPLQAFWAPTFMIFFVEAAYVLYVNGSAISSEHFENAERINKERCVSAVAVRVTILVSIGVTILIVAGDLDMDMDPWGFIWVAYMLVAVTILATTLAACGLERCALVDHVLYQVPTWQRTLGLREI